MLSLLVFLVPILARGADRTPAVAGGAGGWDRIDVRDRLWSEYTHAIARGDDVFFLHGNDLDVRRGDGRWERFGDVLPAVVGPFAAAALDPHGRIVVAVGGGKPGFRLDPDTRESAPVPALALETKRGARLAIGDDGVVYCALGGRGKEFGCVEVDRWVSLPDVVTVNPIGGYSSGLFRFEDLIIAFGDHHGNAFDVEKREWWPKAKLFKQLGFRPAHDRGGMVTQDPEEKNLFMTLGKDSRALGVLDVHKPAFYHLRPRLPFGVRDVGSTLYVTGRGADRRLNLLSQEQGAIFSIPILGLKRIGVDDNLADDGSRFEVWNSTKHGGSMGDLARERDSVCNLCFIEPYVYIQRKNILRRVHYRTVKFSAPQAGDRYGEEFASVGSALCYDGESRIFLFNGFDDELFAIDVRGDGGGGEDLSGISDLSVTKLAPVPVYFGTSSRDGRGNNTAMVFFQGEVYALFEPTMPNVYRMNPERNTWSLETVLPAGVRYTREDGVDFHVDGDRIILLSADTLCSYSPRDGWGEARTVPFRYSSDGGMSAFDAETRKLYVAIGGGSRDLGVIHLDTGAGTLLRESFPDNVAVHGRRIFIASESGTKYLYIWRGNDSAEMWRVPLDGLEGG